MITEATTNICIVLAIISNQLFLFNVIVGISYGNLDTLRVFIDMACHLHEGTIYESHITI